MGRTRSIYIEQFRNAYSVLVGKPEEKRPLGRTRHRWEGNIKMDFKGGGLLSWRMDRSC